MLWIIILVAIIVIVALSIPILSIVLDSPILQRMAESRRGSALAGPEMVDLKKRLGVLENEVEDLGHAMRQMKDETQFLQHLLESHDEKSSRKLPPAT